MLFYRRATCFSLAFWICAGPACSQILFWKHHKKKPQAHAPEVHQSRSSSMIHTQAQFYYDGKLLASVDSANAVLYDSTDPGTQEDVAAINGGRDGVQQAQKVCEAFVPGKDGTVGPGGEIYFDFVHRGDYWILVCAQVKFSGIAKPVWVSGAISISRDEFVSTNAAEYNLPHHVEIVLDPYAAELKAKPVELPKLIAARLATLPPQ
jgi:hypothetical protein